MRVYMCVCVCVCVSFFKFIFIILLKFLFKETKYIDNGKCICLGVCMYVELNWFPGKEK